MQAYVHMYVYSEMFISAYIHVWLGCYDIWRRRREWDWLDQCQAVNTYMYMYKKFDRQKTDK